MNKKEELISELKSRFEKEKKSEGFKTTYDELERVFFIEDFVLKEGFVSDRVMRQISSRMVEKINNWAGYIHGFMMPNPGDLVGMTDAKLLTEEEKKELWEVFKDSIALSAKNSIIGLSHDKRMEAEFIDESMNFWDGSIKPKLLAIMKKVNSEWSK